MERVTALNGRLAEQERRAALDALRVQHARDALDAALQERNPHGLRRQDAQARQSELASRLKEARDQLKESSRRLDIFESLQEHFGKRGVQNMLYTVALAQLEASAATYAAKLSDGRMQLSLAFDDKLRSIRKLVRVRRRDGSFVERSVSQLSGGEWRRIGLALSLAFADFLAQRLSLSTNVLVLDEVMQHMDVDGQAAMAQVLKELNRETTLVIAHGLASDTLSGEFESVDTVEKIGDQSFVHIHPASSPPDTVQK